MKLVAQSVLVILRVEMMKIFKNLFKRKKYAYFVTYYANNNRSFGNVTLLLDKRFGIGSDEIVTKAIGHQNVLINSINFIGKASDLNLLK